MGRITTTILIMVILMNGTATIMEASGLSEDLGVEMNTGVSDSVNDTVDKLRNGFDPNVGAVESLVSFVTAGLSTFSIVTSGILAAPTLMINILGGGSFVTTVVTVLFAPAYVISTLELVSIAIGVRTV